MATVTRVGNLIGEGQPRRAQIAAYVAFGMGAGVMLVSAITFVALRNILPGIYTEDAAVIAAGAGILPIAAAFQLFDGTQVVGSGILRGMGAPAPRPRSTCSATTAWGFPSPGGSGSGRAWDWSGSGGG